MHLDKKNKNDEEVGALLCEGEFEISHDGCEFAGIAECVGHDLKLEILNRQPENAYS
jgi:hypothetical protein